MWGGHQGRSRQPPKSATRRQQHQTTLYNVGNGTSMGPTVSNSFVPGLQAYSAKSPKRCYYRPINRRANYYPAANRDEKKSQVPPESGADATT